MSKIPKNNIITNLHECENDKDIDAMFSFILPPNQKRSFINIFLQSDNSKKLSTYSKKLFTFLLELEQSYHNKIQILNYTNSLVEFLSEIQHSVYLKNNFHFISRSVQQILKFIFLRNEYGSFSIISYKAKSLDLEEIPMLPLFFNQDQEIEYAFKDNLFFIKTFLPTFDEKLLIWCYFENMHSDFCKIIDKRRTYKLDKFSLSIIKQRIQLSKESFYHYPNHFIIFLSKLYPSISQTLENCNLLQKHGSFNQLETSLMFENKDLSFDFDDSNIPFFNVHHFFNVSELSIKNDQHTYAPKSLPATRKKLIKVQTGPKFEFNMIPSMTERFSNSYLSFQSKNYVFDSYPLPDNFSFEKFISVLTGDKGEKGDDDNVFHYYHTSGSFNRAQSNKTISIHLPTEPPNRINRPGSNNLNKKVNINLEKKSENSSFSQPNNLQNIKNNQNQKLKLKTDDLSSRYVNNQISRPTEQDKNFEDKTNDGHYFMRHNSKKNVQITLAPPPNQNVQSPLKKLPLALSLEPPTNNNDNNNNDDNNNNNKVQPKQPKNSSIQIVVQNRNTNKITIQKCNSSSTTDDKQ